MCGELEPLSRVNFFAGKLLTAEDFQAEQEYHRQRSRLHNRCCHGWGIACGLEVSLDGGELAVSPGLALDCVGEQVVLATPAGVSLPAPAAGPAMLYLALVFEEQPGEPIPLEKGTGYGRTLEGSRLELVPADPAEGHVRQRGRSEPCGTAHGVPLARLRLVRKRWRIDSRYRRHRVR